MLQAIKYNLARLTDFTGREDRPTFWWYILFLAILDVVLGLIAGAPMMAGLISAAYHGAQAGVPQDALQAQMMQRMSTQIMGMAWLSGAIKLLMIALSAAACVRRMHDSGNSGWWIALAIAAEVAGFALSYSMLTTMRDAMATAASPADLRAMQQQAGTGWIGLLGWVAPLIVIVFGAMKSSPGPNRYGDAPQSA